MFQKTKHFYNTNKDTIHDLLQSLIINTIPQAKPLFDVAWTTFGGSLRSQDPYAINVNYMKYIFGVGPAYPAPRK